MTVLKAAAALVLWRSGQFDTMDIAEAIGAAEADVCRVLHAARDAERRPDLHLVQSEYAQ